MKRKNSSHAVSSETQSPPPTRKAIDYRETGAVGQHSFLRKTGIASASLAPVLALLVASSAIAGDTFLKFKGGIVEIPVIGTPATPVANVVRGIQPAPSNGCDNPVLLIRTVPSGVWFTAGIPLVIEDD